MNGVHHQAEGLRASLCGHLIELGGTECPDDEGIHIELVRVPGHHPPGGIHAQRQLHPALQAALVLHRTDVPSHYIGQVGLGPGGVVKQGADIAGAKLVDQLRQIAAVRGADQYQVVAIAAVTEHRIFNGIEDIEGGHYPEVLVGLIGRYQQTVKAQWRRRLQGVQPTQQCGIGRHGGQPQQGECTLTLLWQQGDGGPHRRARSHAEIVDTKRRHAVLRGHLLAEYLAVGPQITAKARDIDHQAVASLLGPMDPVAHPTLAAQPQFDVGMTDHLVFVIRHAANLVERPCHGHRLDHVSWGPDYPCPTP